MFVSGVMLEVVSRAGSVQENRAGNQARSYFDVEGVVYFAFGSPE